MLRMRRGNAILSAMLLLLFASQVQAQRSQATLVGTVKDTSGAAVPSAKVTLRNPDTGAVLIRTTDHSGNYTITGLQVGHYSLTVTLVRFKTVTIPDIELQVGQSARIDPVMEVGTLTQEVTVSTTAPLISTASSDVGQVVDRGVLNNIPLNGRAFWQLTQLTPGATYTPAGSNAYGSLTSIRASAVNVVINGSDPDKTGWILDGSSIIEVQSGGTEIQPNVDALEEFKVEGGNMTAEFGRTPTTVTAVIKSGTNQFHGDLFEFLRNEKLDSRNFFFIPAAGSNQKKDVLKRNQYGGTIGGPIRKDKLFFFADMEETMVRQAVVASNVVPSLAQRAGDFSGTSTHLLNPFASYAPFPNNQIPQSLLSPQGSFFLNYLPQPNFQQGNTSRGVFGSALSLNASKADVKIDENITDKDHLMGRYSIVDNTETTPDAFPALGQLGNHARGQDFTMAYTHIFNSSWLNEARVGYYRMIFLFQPPIGGTFFGAPSKANYQGFDSQLYGGFPEITLSGYSGFDGAPSNQLPKSNHIRTYEYADTVSYTSGRHELKAGMQLYHNTTGYITGGQTQGIFNFLGTFSGDSFGDFLLGLPDNASRDPGAPWWGDYGNWPAFFVQDNYRLTQNFTLNLGLRFEVNGYYTGVRGQTSSIDLTTGKLIIPSSFDVTARPISAQLLPLYQDRIEYTKSLGLPNSIINTNKNWAPRAGFAWKPFGSNRWVLRGGFGIFYDYANNNGPNNSVGVPPNTVMDSEFNSRPPAAPTRSWGDFYLGQPLAGLPNPNPGQPCVGFTALSCSTPSLSTTVFGNQSTSHQHEWNFTLQREISSHVSLTMAYVGNISRDQVLSQSVNNPAPGPGAIQTRRPLLQWGTIGQYEYDGSASYNGLQISALSRDWHGLSLQGNYTYSKCMDNGSGGSGAPTVSLIPVNRGVCSLDRTYSSAVSFVYELPFGTGRTFLAHTPGWVNQIVGGWRASGVLTLQSGLPFTPVISGDQANTGVGSQRPNAVGAPILLDNVGCWFYVANNSTCRSLAPSATAPFTVPAQYTYGTSGRDVVRADGLSTLDFSLLKKFKVTESKTAEFRAECFNLANHPVFSAPSATINAASGGQVSSLLVPAREVQLALKFYF